MHLLLLLTFQIHRQVIKEVRSMASNRVYMRTIIPVSIKRVFATMLKFFIIPTVQQIPGWLLFIEFPHKEPPPPPKKTLQLQPMVGEGGRGRKSAYS